MSAKQCVHMCVYVCVFVFVVEEIAKIKESYYSIFFGVYQKFMKL